MDDKNKTNCKRKLNQELNRYKYDKSITPMG